MDLTVVLPKRRRLTNADERGLGNTEEEVKGAYQKSQESHVELLIKEQLGLYCPTGSKQPCFYPA